MDEPVGDSAGGSGVVNELAPVLEGQVGGDEGGGAQVAAVEDRTEEVGAASVEAQISELVDDEELWGGPSSEALVESVSSGGSDEIVDEIGGENEADPTAVKAGEVTDGVGEVSLADAAWAEEHDVGFVFVSAA